MPVEGLRGDAEQEDRSSEASANPATHTPSPRYQQNEQLHHRG